MFNFFDIILFWHFGTKTYLILYNVESSSFVIFTDIKSNFEINSFRVENSYLTDDSTQSHECGCQRNQKQLVCSKIHSVSEMCVKSSGNEEVVEDLILTQIWLKELPMNSSLWPRLNVDVNEIKTVRISNTSLEKVKFCSDEQDESQFRLCKEFAVFIPFIILNGKLKFIG